MPYYTNRQGVIPNKLIDDKPGWILVSDPPAVSEGKELVWLNWEWVVREPKPISDNTIWKFNHTEFKSNAQSNGWLSFSTVQNTSEQTDI